MNSLEEILFLFLENLFLIAVLSWYFLLWRGRGREKKQDVEILEMMNRYYRQNLDAVKERYDQVSMIKHDMRNMLLVLDHLLEKGCVEEARRSIEEQVERIDHIYQLVKTDNVFVNAILNQKLSEAGEKGIETRFCILTSFQGIGDRDICNLFGNLLDNAIEANEKADGEKYLELTLEGDGEELEIVCRNSAPRNVRIRQNHLPATEKAGDFHGYGSRIIREIVERYQGEVSFVSDGREVEALVRLKRNQKLCGQACGTRHGGNHGISSGA